MTLMRVRRAAQLTLPADIRQALNVKEGDYLEASIARTSVISAQVVTSRADYLEASITPEGDSFRSPCRSCSVRAGVIAADQGNHAHVVDTAAQSKRILRAARERTIASPEGSVLKLSSG